MTIKNDQITILEKNLPDKFQYILDQNLLIINANLAPDEKTKIVFQVLNNSGEGSIPNFV